MWKRILFGKQHQLQNTHSARRWGKPPRSFSLETLLKTIRPLPGEWESVLKGRGYAFDRFKEFEPSDNPGQINIPLLAETGDEYVPEHIPFKGAEVLIAADFSSSCSMSPAGDIRDTALFLLAAAAVEKGSPCAILAFSEKLEYVSFFDEPRTQFRRFQKWFDEEWRRREKRARRGTSFGAIAPYVRSKVPERSLVFLVSDFLEEEGLPELLAPMRGRVDLTPVVVDVSRVWEDLPLGTYELEAQDPESGETFPFFITQKKIIEIRAFHAKRKEAIASFFRRKGLSHAVIEEPDENACMRALSKCFRQKIRHRTW